MLTLKSGDWFSCFPKTQCKVSGFLNLTTDDWAFCSDPSPLPRYDQQWSLEYAILILFVTGASPCADSSTDFPARCPIGKAPEPSLHEFSTPAIRGNSFLSPLLICQLQTESIHRINKPSGMDRLCCSEESGERGCRGLCLIREGAAPLCLPLGRVESKAEKDELTSEKKKLKEMLAAVDKTICAFPNLLFLFKSVWS